MSNYKKFAIRGFNPCESLLRHSPEQLRTFLRRMKKLNFNTIILHYDYGWKRYQDLLLSECEANGINIILMTFGPRTFLSYSDWKPSWFAKKEDGTPYTNRLECETYPCAFEPEALAAYKYGAIQWLKSLPPQIKNVHMRAADGLMFCQCEKCRILPDHEKWQPFVDLFAEAVLETRPDLEFETDIYVKRYNIPNHREPYRQMQHIMYDTFYRCPSLPLGCDRDIFNSGHVKYAATEPNPDAVTPNMYHLNRLKEWTTSFPGKMYIHENAMAQGYYGNFQFGTMALLEDLKLYQQLGVDGVCYEAYEPGYYQFNDMFEVLAKALNGEDPDYQPNDVEKQIFNGARPYAPDSPIDLDKYFTDPVQRQQMHFYREHDYSPAMYRKYIEFAFAHEDRFDPLFLGYNLAYFGKYYKKNKFQKLSEGAELMLSYRKLWDFMELVPADQDPRKVCRDIIFELADKIEFYS